MGIKRIFGDFLNKIAEQRDRKIISRYVQYLRHVSSRKDEAKLIKGLILGSYYYIYHGLRQNQPIYKEALESIGPVKKEVLRLLILKLNPLIKSLSKSGNGLRINPGIELLQQTLRCLQYQDLESIGREIWELFKESQDDAKVYLEELSRNLKMEGNVQGSLAALESIKLIGNIPRRLS